MEFLEKIMPNVVDYWPNFLRSIVETLKMVSVSLAFIIVLGTILGIVLVVIAEGGLYENKVLDQIVPKFVNLVRSVPFVIMLTLIMPFTRIIVGTAIGVKGAVVPLIWD